MIQKSNTRKIFLSLREKISKDRALFAAESLRIIVLDKPYLNILSFSSFGSEISTDELNRSLLKNNQLYLPRVSGLGLEIYKVEGIDQLKISEMGILEPDPKFSVKRPLSEIDAILVPGIVFDKRGNRIGYGKGYYDRLLSKMPGTPTIGVGFQEQLCTFPLSTDPWDISLKEIILT